MLGECLLIRQTCKNWADNSCRCKLKLTRGQTRSCCNGRLNAANFRGICLTESEVSATKHWELSSTVGRGAQFWACCGIEAPPSNTRNWWRLEMIGGNFAAHLELSEICIFEFPREVSGRRWEMTSRTGSYFRTWSWFALRFRVANCGRIKKKITIPQEKRPLLWCETCFWRHPWILWAHQVCQNMLILKTNWESRSNRLFFRLISEGQLCHMNHPTVKQHPIHNNRARNFTWCFCTSLFADGGAWSSA